MKNILLILALFLSSCYIYEGTYTTTPTYNSTETEQDYWLVTYVPTIGLYYYNDLPYWGYYEGYYYYYGYRHYYPWWYYYNIIPSYNYHVHTHVHCHLGHRNYVERPTNGRRFDNKNHKSYNVSTPNNNGFVTVKNHSNVPTKWRTQTEYLPKVKIHVNRNKNTITIPTNRNNVIIKETNTNRSNTNIKINRNNSNKTNNKTFNSKSNKTNIRKNTKKPR